MTAADTPHSQATGMRRVRALTRAAAAALFTLVLLSMPVRASAASIFLDPGHGGRYPGAVYAGVEEQYVNLLIALETRNVLLERGHSVAVSRTSDTAVDLRDRPTWHWDEGRGTYDLFADGKTGAYSNDGSSGGIPYDDLQARCDLANRWGADIFISIHNNAAGSTATGTETFYNSWSTETDALLSARLASFIHAGVVGATGVRDRGVEDVGYYVIRWANMPAALIEVQFLSNPSDRARLLSASFRHDVAVGIANGVDRYLASDPYTARERRIEGADRYVTAVAAADAGWPEGAETVLLASGELWPDSLAAASLSVAWNAPILLTPGESLHPATAEALARLAPSRIVALGGEGAVSTATVDAARLAAGLTEAAVNRIAGANRYETAALIAQHVGAPGGAVAVVSGEAYPDALSIASYAAANGMPILLTYGDALPASAAAFIGNLGTTVDRVVVVGGAGAVPEQAVTALGDAYRIVRLSGEDRYGTNRAVIDALWSSGTVAPFVATGADFPDAIVAGALAARERQPVLLCGRAYLPGETREWVMHNTARIGGFTMMGGDGAVSHLLEWQLEKARH